MCLMPIAHTFDGQSTLAELCGQYIVRHKVAWRGLGLPKPVVCA